MLFVIWDCGYRKLKMECGGNFTAKLEGMMKDM